jgi:hypothetical protein
LTDKITIKKLVGPIFNPTHHSIHVCLVVLAVGKVLVQKRCGKKLGFSVWSIPRQKLECMVMYRTYYHHNQPVVSAKTGMYGNVPYLLPSQQCPFLCSSPGNDVPFYAYHTGPSTHNKQTMSPFMLIRSGNDDVPFYAYQLLISRFMPIRVWKKLLIEFTQNRVFFWSSLSSFG